MALGTLFSGGAALFGGRRVGKYAQFGLKQSQRIGEIAGGVMGVGLFAANKANKLLETGTSFSNPVFNNMSAQAYGKRGIDANNLNTNGLVHGLHSQRRRS